MKLQNAQIFSGALVALYLSSDNALNTIIATWRLATARAADKFKPVQSQLEARNAELWARLRILEATAVARWRDDPVWLDEFRTDSPEL